MNPKTGEIKEFNSPEELQKALAEQNWIELDAKPDKNCKICHGRGHNGYNITLKQYVPCICTSRKKVNERKQKKESKMAKRRNQNL